MVGITAYGAYIPRLRLSRKAAAQATGWLNPSLYGSGRGESALANWDEDSITMAVEAGRDCLNEADPAATSAVYFASTSAPFSQRLNASIVAAALGLSENTAAYDLSSSPRCGISALIQASEHAVANAHNSALVLASDYQRSPAASPASLLKGDAAAAFSVGSDSIVAEFVGSHTQTVDFVDSYRGSREDFSQNWEERWVREEGYLKLVPATISQLLKKTNTPADSIDAFICPCPFRGVPNRIAKTLGIADDAVVDNLDSRCGDTGTAHPLLVLAHYLEQAQPGQKILVVGFGQGCEAIILETTQNCTTFRPKTGPQQWLDKGVSEPNYFKYMIFKDLVDWDQGADAEADNKTLLSSLYRDRHFVNRLEGWHCPATGETLFGSEAEFKMSQREQTFERKSFADSAATLLTLSSNYLGLSLEPAICTGIAEFAEGGRLVINLTEADPQQLRIGGPLRMSYRIHAVDKLRGFTRYFWKGVPIQDQIGDQNSGESVA